jgi:REP element-mobilizing transposase RayT
VPARAGFFIAHCSRDKLNRKRSVKSHAYGFVATVIAHHLVWTTYGTWLPNDPRGSWSQTVLSPELAELGEIHFGRRKIQPSRQIVREFKRQAESVLTYPTILFDRRQIEFAVSALGESLRKFNYTCYACAAMPDHVHLLIRKHRDSAEAMIENLQRATREMLIAPDGILPAGHPVWTAGGWKRFLGSPNAVRSVIRYIEANPTKTGRPVQAWPFVKNTTAGRFTSKCPTEKVEPSIAAVYTPQ